MAENSMCCMNWEQMNSERHLYEKKAEEINNQKQNEMELPVETSGGKYFVHGSYKDRNTSDVFPKLESHKRVL